MPRTMSSSDPPTSFPKGQIKILLVENIHPSAHELFRAEGFQLEVLKGALSDPKKSGLRFKVARGADNEVPPIRLP